MTSDGAAAKEFHSVFNDRCLKSSSRLLILVCLSMNEKLGFTELSKLTGLSKGSLGNHLIKLQVSNYITVKEYSFFSSKRISVKITQEGKEAVKRYIKAINNMSILSKGEEKEQDSTDGSID